MSTKRINASEMDFDKIKANLIGFMKEQPGPFQDYNYEGSALNTIIDTLSYITHMNAVNANFALNETFLDTSQLRQSVVSHAKLLGYTPRSTRPANATVNIELVSPIDTGVENSPLTILRGTNFSTNIEGKSYNLIAKDTHTIKPNSDGVYIFEDVILEQGTLKALQFDYDSYGFENYIIRDAFVNTDSIEVKIYSAATSTEFKTYSKAINITDINAKSEVYFLEESREGFYQISFGDGIIGKKPEIGNIIEVVFSSVGRGNINTGEIFTLIDSIEGNSDAIITTTKSASGGAPAEDIESIRFNAPLGFVAQNRAVTPDDYKGILQNTFGNIEALTVWGGEDNDPPDYGKVYVSIKPLDGEVLSEADKNKIIGQYLKPKNIVSITPKLVDPSYTYINLDIFFKYNPNLSNVTVAGLSNMINTNVQTYAHTELNTFDGVFRSSNVSTLIDNSDPAIISNITRVSMYKKFTPVVDEEKLYVFDFNQGLTKYGKGYMTSTAFRYNNIVCILQDFFDVKRNKHIIRIIDAYNDNIIHTDIGEVNIASGRITLNGFNLSEHIGGPIMKIYTKPASSDISPMRNELLTIIDGDSTIQGEVDTMAVGGTTAGINYSTVSDT